MAIRFYFPDGLIPDVSPDFDGPGGTSNYWDDTGGADRGVLASAKQSTAFATAAREVVDPGAFGQMKLVRQYVSEPLAAQTLLAAGTVKCQIRAKENNALANMRSCLFVRIVSQDGITYRDAPLLSENYNVWEGYTYGNEFVLDALTNNEFAPSGEYVYVSADFAIQAGDRIVVEIGFYLEDVTATGSLEFGDNSASDLPEDELSTDQYCSWIEFSQTLTFIPEYTPIVITCTSRTKTGGSMSLDSPLIANNLPLEGGCKIYGALSLASSRTPSLACLWSTITRWSTSLAKGQLPTSHALSCRVALKTWGKISLSSTTITLVAQALPCLVRLRTAGSCSLREVVLTTSALASRVLPCTVATKSRGTLSLASSTPPITNFVAPVILKSSGSLTLRGMPIVAARKLTFNDILLRASGSLGLVSNPCLPVDLLLSGGCLMGGSLWTQSLVHNTWCVSDSGFQVSLFTNFNFTSLSEFEGRLYATGPDGIYLLEGATDRGRKIMSALRINSRLGSNRVKKLKRLFCDKDNPDLQLRAEVDGAETYHDLIDAKKYPGNHIRFRPKLRGREFTFDILDFDELSLVDFVYALLGK